MTSFSGSDALPISIADIDAASMRLQGSAVRTPLLESPLLNDELGFRLLVKAEPLQKTGSFKFRGAFNLMCQIPVQDRSRGVVAFSSGNHAQGVAAAAHILKMPATIVMPADAPQIKIENTKAWGAKVVTYDRYDDDRESIGVQLMAETKATLVKPYDDPRIMAGQGTVGLEIMEQARELGVTPNAVLVCCGGGGLTSGVATAVKHAAPDTKVYAVEPEGFDDTARSLVSGEREEIDPEARSICDALLSRTPGEITFSVNRRLLSGCLVVTDAQALHAMAVAFRHLKLVLEPGGAVAIAAALKLGREFAGQTVVAVASGGNVDADMFTRALESQS